MKSIRLLLTIAFVIPFLSCNAQPAKKEVKASSDNSDKIEAYYFHYMFL